MGNRKSKDPRKPSKGFLESIGETATAAAASSSAPVAPAPAPEPVTTAQLSAALSSLDQSGKSKTNIKITKKGGKKGQVDEAVLRQVIKDLGGDEEDFELVQGVDSDSEDEDEKKDKKEAVVQPVDKKLKSELASFMKSLDFAAVASDAGDVEEEEEEEVDEEEDEDEDEDDEDEDDDDDEEDEEEEDDDEEEEDEEDEEDAPAEPEFVIKSGLQNVAEARIDNIPQEPIWYHTPLAHLPTPAEPLEPLHQFRFAGIQSRAHALLDKFRESQGSATSSARKGSTDQAFIAQILKDGTHQDKLSALILLVRESPLHRINELERLKTMAGGSSGGMGGREEKVATLRALADWWVSGGGKEAGKLKYLADQPLLAHPALTERHLLVFAFEDWLKKWYFSILQILEMFLHDTLPFVRTQCLAVTYKLLAGNAEQEQNLLRLGVNKLGDNDKSVAAKASYHLLVLLQNHPAMKAVVVREVASLVLKPVASKSVHQPVLKGKAASAAAAAHESGTDHARYYGLITLNQIMLTSREREVAGRLVDVYFEIFRELLGVAPETESGENQLTKTEKVAGKIDNWQGRKKGTRKSKNKRKDKDENEVEQGDSKLITAVLTGVNRALPFARLDEKVFSGHAETLFRVTHTGTFNISIRALMLIHQIASAKDSIMDRFYRTLYESLLDPRLVDSSKQAMYLNLLFKSIRADKNLGRQMAFVKRLLQVMMGHQPPFICGALYLLGELFNTSSGLRALINEAEDNGVEHFEDVGETKKESAAADAAASADKAAHGYDGRKRDPVYANAQGSCLWELIPFAHHYHPSVSLQANQLLDLKLPLTGSEDITSNTLVAFLDRFVYRNPKKTVTAKGASIMQPAAASRSGNVTVIKSRSAAGATVDGYVNSEAFWRKKVEDVPADQLFFHKYFAAKLEKEAAIKKTKKKKSRGEDEDVEMEGEDDAKAEVDEDEDPEEAEIWRVMQSTMPDAEDDGDLMEDEDEPDIDYSESEEEDEDEDEEEEEEKTTKAAEKPGKVAAAAAAASEDEDESEDEDDEGLDDKDAGAFSDDDDDDLGDLLGEEDEDDLLDLDDMPDIALDVEVSEEEADVDADTAGKKRKREGDEKKERRKKRKALPLLASAEDYAALIDGAEEENL